MDKKEPTPLGFIECPHPSPHLWRITRPEMCKRCRKESKEKPCGK